MKNNQGYILHIESLRAIAALVVLFYHFVMFSDTGSHLVQNKSIRDFSYFGAQGVEMFYIISGYVMALSLTRKNYVINDYGRYLLKRALRILPLYWTVIAMMIAIMVIWGNALDWKNIGANMFFVVDVFDGTTWINPVFSTLRVEVQFYILLGLIFPLIRWNHWMKYGLFLVWLTLGYLYKDSYSVLTAAPYFITGMLLLDLEMQKTIKAVDISLIVAMAIGFSFIGLYEDTITMAVTIFLFVVVKPSWNPLNQLGKISYSVYLTHGIFGGLFLFFVTSPLYGNVASGWLVAPAMLISILGAWIVYSIVEKQSVHWSKAISFKQKKG